MHIVRVDLKNGLHIELGFGLDARRAYDVHRTISAKIGATDGGTIEVADLQGRVSVFSAAEINHAMLVNLTEEVTAMVAQKLQIEKLQQDLVASYQAEVARRPSLMPVRSAVPAPNGLPANLGPRRQ